MNTRLYILLFLLCYIASSQVIAARYSIEQITENNISAINSSGTLAGVTASGLPFVWPRNKAANSYLEIDKIILDLPSGVNVTEVHVEDINNALPSDDGETTEGETVLGWYVDENGLPQSIVWEKAPDTRSHAQSYELTSGLESSGSRTDTAASDNIYHLHADASGTIDLYYEFNIVSDGYPTSVNVDGYLSGISNSVDVFAFNWSENAWNNIGTINGQTVDEDSGEFTNIVSGFNLEAVHVSADSNNQLVRIRFYTPGGLTSANLAIDQLLVRVEPRTGSLVYNVRKLKPHLLTNPICTGANETDYEIPECINQNDAKMMYRALKCSDNRNWQPGNNIIVDLNFDSSTGAVPPCANSLPVCEFKMAKITFLIEASQGDDQEASELVETFKYIYNHDYLEQKCIAPAHAEMIKIAFECEAENSTWNEEEITSPVTQCDIASKPTGINNDNIISGTSIRKDNSERPIFWLKTEELDENNLPVYDSGDLGAVREVVLQSPNGNTSPSEQSDIEARTKESLLIAAVKNEDNILTTERIVKEEDLKEGVITEIKRDKGIIEQTFKTTFKEGKTVNVDKFRNAALGFLKLNSADTEFQPVYWPAISLSSLINPQQLFAPEIIGKQNDCPSILYKEFNGNVTLERAAGGNVYGWYVDENGNSRPINWLRSLCKDKDNITVEGHDPKNIITFDEINIGKALDANTRENIGTAEVTVTLPDNQVGLESRAYFRDTLCGIQDLNELLATPTDALTLTEARHLSASETPSPFVTKGIRNDNGETGTYILYPQEIFLDLSVTIATDHDRLTVGDEHILTITVNNDGAPDINSEPNYATCIKFTVTASVVTDNNLVAKSPDDIESEKLGGLTFKGYEGNDKAYCITSPVSITCAIERLNVNDPVTVNVLTEPRPLLADRVVRTSVVVSATESEKLATMNDNFASVKTSVDREACFIATAAYGSYMAPEVKSLRKFRDEVLLQTNWGRELVSFYYEVSPPLANFIASNETLKQITRWVLTPLVYGVAYPIQAGLLLLSVFALFFIRRKQKFA